MKKVIALHEAKCAADHGVLEISRTIHGCDFAGQSLPESKVLRPPRDLLSQSDQAGGNAASGDCLLTPMHVPQQVDFHTPSQIEAALDRRLYCCELLESDHQRV